MLVKCCTLSLLHGVQQRLVNSDVVIRTFK
jgi:hypothetical protein